jgi:Flp pilus assembly protein TadD
MSARLRVALWMGAVVIVSHGQTATAQSDAHARALARVSCQTGKHSDTVTDATAAVEHEPNEPGPRMRLADALVDQGCYQEAVDTLETLQEAHPRNAEVSAKLRDVRSLVTEQTYIEGLTQSAEVAKLARNQLRCTRLADITACEDALRSKPDDVQLLLAQGDALVQANRPAEAVTAYRRAAQLKSGDEAVKTKLAAAEALQAKIQQAAASTPAAVAVNTEPRAKPPKKVPAAGPPGGASGAATTVAAVREKATPTTLPNGGQHLTATPGATVAALTTPENNKTYSNDAQPGQTN